MIDEYILHINIQMKFENCKYSSVIYHYAQREQCRRRLVFNFQSILLYNCKHTHAYIYIFIFTCIFHEFIYTYIVVRHICKITRFVFAMKNKRSGQKSLLGPRRKLKCTFYFIILVASFDNARNPHILSLATDAENVRKRSYRTFGPYIFSLI